MDWNPAAVRALRKALRYSQEDLGQKLGASTKTIRSWEHGEHRPRPYHEQALDTVRERMSPDQRHRLDGLLSDAGGPALVLGSNDQDGSDVLDSSLDIAERMQWVSASNVDDVALDQIGSAIADLIQQYERRGPRSLAAQAVRNRRWIDGLIRERQHPHQREQLYVAAAHLSGILAAIALDLGRQPLARAYAVEAFHLAQLARRGDVQAWVLGTQSLIEYYAGNFMSALTHARHGQALAGHGGQDVRLILNGEARALSRLHDVAGVEDAVQRGLALVDRDDTTEDVSASLTLGSYCYARAAGNAATAYLWIGQPTQARVYAEQALVTFDAQGLQGPRALTRLDIAVSLIQDAAHAEPERAAVLTQEALTVAGAQQFQPIAQRAEEFVTAAAPWRDVAAVREVTEMTRDLSSSMETPMLSEGD